MEGICLPHGRLMTLAALVYYLHSWSINNRQHSLKLTLKFRYGTFSIEVFLLFSYFA